MEAQENGDVQGLKYIIRSGNPHNTSIDIRPLAQSGQYHREEVVQSCLRWVLSPNPATENRTKLLIEDYISETTSALLYIFSLPSPNSETSNFPQVESAVSQGTSENPVTHLSPALVRPHTSSLDVNSVAANVASVGFSSETISNPTLSFQEKKSFFLQSRQTFGSTALVLQGGSVFGLCHLGVVRGLWKRGLFPRILVGWGVGGLIASLGVCACDS